MDPITHSKDKDQLNIHRMHLWQMFSMSPLSVIKDKRYQINKKIVLATLR